jgi:argininosuccinate lyase
LNKLTNSEIKNSVQGTKVDPTIVSEIIMSTTITSSLKNRISFGSSGFAEQTRMIKDRIKKTNDYRIKITTRESDLSNALERLNEKISILIK